MGTDNVTEEEFDRMVDEKVSQFVDEGLLAMSVDPETGEDILLDHAEGDRRVRGNARKVNVTTLEVATIAGDGDALFRAMRWAHENLRPATKRMRLNASGSGRARDWTGREALAYIAYRKTVRLLLGIEGKRGGTSGIGQIADRVASLIRLKGGPIGLVWYFSDLDSPPIFCQPKVAAEMLFYNGGVALPIYMWAGYGVPVAA